MSIPNFLGIVREAVKAYDHTKEMVSITDISAKVSTNYVYQITFSDENNIIAKLSYFGKFEHFKEDHSIINALANNLPSPFENVLSRSLIKGNRLFVHRYQDEVIDAWVVFYRPIRIKKRMPKRLNETHIRRLGKTFACFHRACDSVRNTLPASSKTMEVDIRHLLRILSTSEGKHDYRMHTDLIQRQSELFLTNIETLGANDLAITPVFVDWNIGNFSVTNNLQLYSRWDYDWFRMSSRMMDFYFFSRIVSDIGDRTVFSYNIDPLMEERFLLFLKAYHQEYPLKKTEILFLKEVYRFFLLNYVIKYGQYFFHPIYANRLQHEVYTHHLPTVDERFDATPLLKALNLH